MIPIKYNGDLKAYDDFIKRFQDNLTKCIERGYLGNCRTVNNPKKKKAEDKEKEKEKIELYYKSLPTHDIQEKYLKATGYLSLDELMKAVDNNKKVSVPEQMLCDEAVTFLTELNNDLKRITNADDAELKKIINEYQTRFVALTGGTSDEPNRTSDVYEAIYLAFVKHGYDASGFRDIVWKASGVKVCPYCNRIYVGKITVRKKDISSEKKEGSSKEEAASGVKSETSSKEEATIKGQLDHFYPKDKYPYLAISKYNLVPSCGYCNGAPGKSDKDPYLLNVVNPYSLKTHDGLRFFFKSFDEDILDLNKSAESLEIGVDTSKNMALGNNEAMFHLEDVYGYHSDIAAEILFKHNALSSAHYAGHLKTLLNGESPLSAKDRELLYWGVFLEDDQLGRRPMSKFTKDLIDYLNSAALSRKK